MENIINTELKDWLNTYVETCKDFFGDRVKFLGIQGKYPTFEDSEIDIVVILDQVTITDLETYGSMLDALPHRDGACGFIAGSKELLAWKASDIFQFYYDTIPIMGSMDFIIPLIEKDDIRRAIRMGACDLYHDCGHNMIHEKNLDVLRALYQSAIFTLQAVYFDRTGEYVAKRSELLKMLSLPEQNLLQTGMTLKNLTEITSECFQTYSEQLFQWASTLIGQYESPRFLNNLS